MEERYDDGDEEVVVWYMYVTTQTPTGSTDVKVLLTRD
jgi:hypothetical protein